MKSMLSRRPSPALVISCIALFVSLGGVSYGVATGFIDSREIKNNQVRSKDLRNNGIRTFDIRNNEVRGFDIRNSSVQGRDIALNTLTGADVSEQDLEKVPSAAAADTAASAGGVTPKAFGYAGEAGGAFVPVLALGGLTLEARCVAPSDLEVRANPAVANSEISSASLPPAPDDERFRSRRRSLGGRGGRDRGWRRLDRLRRCRRPGGERATPWCARSQRRTRHANDCGFFGVAQAG